MSYQNSASPLCTYQLGDEPVETTEEAPKKGPNWGKIAKWTAIIWGAMWLLDNPRLRG